MFGTEQDAQRFNRYNNTKKRWTASAVRDRVFLIMRLLRKCMVVHKESFQIFLSYNSDVENTQKHLKSVTSCSELAQKMFALKRQNQRYVKKEVRIE